MVCAFWDFPEILEMWTPALTSWCRYPVRTNFGGDKPPNLPSKVFPSKVFLLQSFYPPKFSSSKVFSTGRFPPARLFLSIYNVNRSVSPQKFKSSKVSILQGFPLQSFTPPMFSLQGCPSKVFSEQGIQLTFGELATPPLARAASTIQ